MEWAWGLGNRMEFMQKVFMAEALILGQSLTPPYARDDKYFIKKWYKTVNGAKLEFRKIIKKQKQDQ